MMYMMILFYSLKSLTLIHKHNNNDKARDLREFKALWKMNIHTLTLEFIYRTTGMKKR